MDTALVTLTCKPKLGRKKGALMVKMQIFCENVYTKFHLTNLKET